MTPCDTYPQCLHPFVVVQKTPSFEKHFPSQEYLLQPKPSGDHKKTQGTPCIQETSRNIMRDCNTHNLQSVSDSVYIIKSLLPYNLHALY